MAPALFGRDGVVGGAERYALELARHMAEEAYPGEQFCGGIVPHNRRRVFVTDLGGGGFDVSGYVSTDRWYHGLHVSEFSRKIAVLGGVDIDRFSPDERVRRDAIALFVGRLLPHKGVDVLIAALPAGMRLEIIGQPCDPPTTRSTRSPTRPVATTRTPRWLRIGAGTPQPGAATGNTSPWRRGFSYLRDVSGSLNATELR